MYIIHGCNKLISGIRVFCTSIEVIRKHALSSYNVVCIHEVAECVRCGQT